MLDAGIHISLGGEKAVNKADHISRTRSDQSLVIAIDGPAGAGKSSVARKLADELGFAFLDTGALYRCVTLAVLRAGLPMDKNNDGEIQRFAESLSIDVDGDRVKLNGEDVTQAIRQPEVSAAIGRIADNVGVRRALTRQQRALTSGQRVVTEGRDQGTEVFPDSPCKIFLVASPEERANRRLKELQSRGIGVEYNDVLQQQIKRDREDQSRPVGALRKADDAIEVCTDNKSLEQVVGQLFRIVRDRLERQAVINAEGQASVSQEHAPATDTQSKSTPRRSWN